MITVDRRGKLPASQANVERQEHGSVQHETVSDWEVRPQQHMNQLAKSHGGDWQPWTTDPGNPALLMPFVTRGRSAASAVVSGSPRSRWRFRTAARFTWTVPGFSRPAMCAAKALNMKPEAGRGSHSQTAKKPR